MLVKSQLLLVKSQFLLVNSQKIQVPRALSDLYKLAADRVTATLKHAAVLWLQSETEEVQRFGMKLLPFLQPRAPEMRKVAR
jgi:hypothetical protein